MNFNRPFVGSELSERRIVPGDAAKTLGAHLKIADQYVDLLNELPKFRDMSVEQLFKLLPKKYHRHVPPIGENLGIREAAYEREVRQARAVMIGMLATPEQIDQFQAQRFLDRL